MTTFAVLGKPTPRVDGVEKVTGTRRYSADVLVEGTLWGKALRSPLAHARIVKIDASAARALPGVDAVLTADDLPPRPWGRRVYDIHWLARDRVRFIGDRVAVVAAEDPNVAEEALALIQVEYEELPAVFDPLEAMREGAPVLHPDFQSYKNATQLPPIPNVHSYVKHGRGDVERGFAEAEVVFEDRFTMPMQHHGYIEPHACVVYSEPDGHVRVWNCNKQPFSTQEWMADAAGVAAEQVTVMPVSIGGDFGGKGSPIDEPLAYFLSRATGRPIRMVMTYTEELMAAAPRHAAVVTIKTGLTRDGGLVAQHAKLVFNTGAYAGHKPHPKLGLVGAEAACGVYRTPNTLIEAYCVYTNQVPCGHFRAPGWIQAAFSIESHMDMLAYRLGMDPLKIRRINVLGPHDSPPTGDHWKDFRARDVLNRAARLGGWGTPKPIPRGSNRSTGRGLALTYEHIGTGKSGAIMSVDESGRVKLITGVPDVGTGAHTMFRQLAAEILTIAPDEITVEIGDTSSAPYDSGSGADRVTYVAGSAVHGAATKLKGELCDLAAELMGWPEGSVRLEQGRFAGDSSGDGLAFRELAGRAARASGGKVEIRNIVNLEGHLEERNATAHVAEVEIDRESGQVVVTQIVSVEDIGTVLNPQLAEGQVTGAAITGFGYAVMEHLRVEDGRITTLNLADYKLPSVADVPDYSNIFLESNEGPSPFGSKAAGEVGICGVAPSIANAVYDAVGVRITDLPITAEKVFRALRESGTQ